VKNAEEVKIKLRKMINKLICFTLMLTILFPWGKTGHRATGEVAEFYLTDKTRLEIQKILKDPSLAVASTWADEMRSNPNFRKYSAWHYVNMPHNVRYIDSKKSSKGDVVQAIKICKKNLKDSNASIEDKAFHLRFLVHLVGDIHQPLHVGRAEDRGGNDIKVKWFGNDTNLHRVWDTHIIDDFQMSYTELANHLQNNFNAGDITLMTEDEWIDESQQLVNKVYSEVKNKDSLGYTYIYENFDLIKLQLFTAGIRLADTLNSIFDE
jgi:hypothetical protein